jgi:butyryl-CoA dehydrogenase
MASDGTYRLRGSKIFISGADQSFSENVVNMTLARIDGAPPGTKGISLFAVPRMRPENGALVDNDVAVAGAIHKIGWKGLPSLALNFGERDDCHGWLVGEPNRGLAHMFQMMNEARLMIGMSAVATALVAYHEAVSYARVRPQGRALTQRDFSQPQVAIIEHADVRRMLLRAKAIAEGAYSLVLTAARFADVSEHGADDDTRRRARMLLDLLTPVAKTFPSERGFDVTVIAVQVHGGYGYSSEYLPESWMRDQKLNSIHEGTTGIQGLDLLGRKAVAGGGEALRLWLDEIAIAVARARAANVDPRWCERLEETSQKVAMLTMQLGQAGLAGDIDGMLAHSNDYMDLFSVVTIGWQWLLQAAAAREGLARHGSDAAFYEGKLRAAQYWFASEMSRVEQLVELCATKEESYVTMRAEWF